MSIDRVLRWVFVVALGVAAIWLAWPSRNSFGQSDIEALIGRCTTSAKTVISVYFAPAPLLVDDWVSVTTKLGEWSREKQVFVIDGDQDPPTIRCRQDGITVTSDLGIFDLSEAAVTALRVRPRMVDPSGALRDLPDPVVSIVSIQRVVALMLAIVALRSARRLRSKRTQGNLA